jgi:hypothetical protein
MSNLENLAAFNRDLISICYGGQVKTYILGHKREVVFGAILCFVASLSFALGYSADHQLNHAPIIIEKCSHN